jgi:hypothetical protein
MRDCGIALRYDSVAEDAPKVNPLVAAGVVIVLVCTCLPAWADTTGDYSKWRNGWVGSRGGAADQAGTTQWLLVLRNPRSHSKPASSAIGSGPRGRRFKSSRPDQI